MKIFHCGHCDQLVFFENTTCVNCGHVLAYLPDQENLGTLEPDGEDRWRSLSTADGIEERAYRLCKNDRDEDVCNWAVPVDDSNPYCLSCRLTRIIPDLSRPGDRAAWARLEASKRRLIYSLLRLDLPLANKMEDPLGGLAFEFLADPDPGTPGAVPVLTGHDGGVITINVAEADDAERERRRHQMHEPYRTILGHFRHEIGHYYWDRLIKDSEWIDAF
ncbi:MAG: putative zinc-binding metallopeptidase, partial [Planctomycetaceae bacterium]|nr:putative zinc-binding metallopeptidase [Planctomycetaceae bacterium]MBV8228562.1 putative zinc-binding metallopeptidase [Planctomycetaceae bacterium]